jgi:uncharacterized protein
VIKVIKRGSAILFAVRVVPRASRDAIEGEWQGAIKIRLAAPPVDDRANESLCRLLAARLSIPRSAVRIVAGERSRTKHVEISGVNPQQVLDLIAPPQPSTVRNHA